MDSYEDIVLRQQIGESLHQIASLLRINLPQNTERSRIAEQKPEGDKAESDEQCITQLERSPSEVSRRVAALARLAVLREPTTEMLYRGCFAAEHGGALEIWRAMYDASVEQRNRPSSRRHTGSKLK